MDTITYSAGMKTTIFNSPKLDTDHAKNKDSQSLEHDQDILEDSSIPKTGGDWKTRAVSWLSDHPKTAFALFLSSGFTVGACVGVCAGLFAIPAAVGKSIFQRETTPATKSNILPTVSSTISDIADTSHTPFNPTIPPDLSGFTLDVSEASETPETPETSLNPKILLNKPTVKDSSNASNHEILPDKPSTSSDIEDEYYGNGDEYYGDEYYGDEDEDYYRTYLLEEAKKSSYNCYCPDEDINIEKCLAGNNKQCHNLKITLSPISTDNSQVNDTSNSAIDLKITDALRNAADKLQEVVLGHRNFRHNHYNLEIEYDITCTPSIGFNEESQESCTEIAHSILSEAQNGIPIKGEITINRDLIKQKKYTNEKLHKIFLHEMIHVLGMGFMRTTDDDWYHLLDFKHKNKTMPFYVGRYGVKEFNRIQRKQCKKIVYSKLPMDSNNRHFNEHIFGDELMTPKFNRAGKLSKVTLGVLKDMGFKVDKTKAEEYQLPSCEKREAIAFNANCNQKIRGKDAIICPNKESEFHTKLNDLKKMFNGDSPSEID